MASVNRRVLPGFSLTLGYTVFYLSVLVLLPIAACFLKAGSLSFEEFWGAVWTDRARAAYLLTFGAAFVAAIVNVFLGLLLAWVLIRYTFPGKRLVDSLVDLPLALPTAVGGLVYAGLYVEKGWLGQFLVPWGIHGAYSRFAIVLVLIFVGLPFVVRTVQPVLEDLDPEYEEAAASRRHALANVLGCHPSHTLPGTHHGFCTRLFPRHWRIRLGGLRLGEHAL
jgi:sulfate/thiosulfate transport system permease protein